jgi:tetratricopeptide (TPR) repeat protein
MVPRALMLVTKNRAGGGTGLILAMVVLMTACSPPGPRAMLKGKKLLDAGNYDAAARQLKIATSLMPTNANAWNYLGVAYHRAGQETNAAAAYTRALALNRELLEARFNLGCLWLEQNKLDAAKSEFTAYTMRRGHAPEGWLKLGLAQLRATNSLAAEKSFREATNLNPESAEALNGLGLAQLQRGRASEAARSFSAALAQQPDYRPALLNLATVSHQDLNNRSEALRHYREYLELQPRAADWEAVNVLAQSLAQPSVGHTRPAADVSARVAAVTNGMKPPTVVASRAGVLPKPETNQSVARLSPTPMVVPLPPPVPVEVVRLPPEPVVKTVSDKSQNSVPLPPAVVPTNATAAPVPKMERRGGYPRLNPLKRDTKPAADETAVTASGPIPALPVSAPEIPPTAGGRYVYLSPGVPQAGNRPSAERALIMGQQAQNIGRLAEAIQAYRRAGQLDGSYFEAHYRLGLAAFEARSFRLALSAWETALALQPDSADARYNFALTLKASNYPNDAAIELEKLLAVHPDEARGHLTLGNLYAEQLHDLSRARQHYGRVLLLDPRNPQAQAIRYWLVANPG